MKYTRFFDSSPLLLAILDSSYKFDNFNARWTQNLSVDAHVLEQSSLLDVMHSADRAVIENSLQARQDCEHTVRLVQQDGTPVWVALQISWVEDEQAYYVTAQNETHHQAVLADLENARLYLDDIIQTVRDPLVVLDEMFHIQTVNRAFYETFQVTEQETLGALIAEVGNGQWQIPQLAKLLKEIIKEDTHFEDFEIDHTFPMIGRKTMLLNARRIEQHKQKQTRILLAIEDVTERKQIESALDAQTKELARSNVELEQFAYVASHDLQEPLRMVVSYMQLVLRRYHGKLDQDADEFIGFAVDGATRMQTLINDLLAYSRVGRKAHPFEAVKCDLVLKIVLDNMSISMEETEAVITADSLPTVMGDMSQLVMVFQNLLTNGLKFHGETAPRIHVGAKRDGDDWTFSVRDNGIGIEPQYWERIFLIFERLHNREDYAGTGIGLAITKKIIEQHGGHIWLKSEIGHGSEFLFTLPIIKTEGNDRA